MKGVKSDYYTFKDIFERDKGICGICKVAVDPLLTGDDSMRGSIDHIKPINKGGDDTLLNVQLAHLKCNLQKSDLYEV